MSCLGVDDGKNRKTGLTQIEKELLLQQKQQVL